MGSKYIFITGGVLSSLGKGISSASIALLLESRGCKVAMMKLDPYLNVDPGTMNPFQHGEVYVTDDGAETDLDLGHYFRFTNSALSRVSNATSGQIYDTVLKEERQGKYLGKTVQVIPHITNEIRRRIEACSLQEDHVDVTIVEVGGTVGDMESEPFLEAIRQFRYEKPKECINIHLTYVPFIEHAQEIKTKPTQHSVQQLQRRGIFPDIILCRSQKALSQEIKDKISLFCSVPKSAVIDVIDVKNSIYEIPLMLQKSGLDTTIASILGLKTQPADLQKWQEVIHTIIHAKQSVTIGIVGKYLQHKDAYKSVFEALLHGGIANGVRVEIACIDSDTLQSEEDCKKQLSACAGILVPGGFGTRGWEGKILAAEYCRKHNIPYFGICLGMQAMCVEFARNVLDIPEANSTEVEPTTKAQVISLLTEQKKIQDLGGTMRLGKYPCVLKPSTKTFFAYKKEKIFERHRHRYELNAEYHNALEEKGLKITGILPERELCEIVENLNHRWMIGVQFHPELISKPTQPHPLFAEFIKETITT